MHQTREEVQKRMPILRKGNKYVARSLSNLRDSVPVVIAVRDILNLARTSKEVKKMMQKNLLKINDRPVKDHRESIRLFNILEAGKKYELILSPTKKYLFRETKADSRLCKVIGKKLLRKDKVQINLHDGSNILSKDKINVGDSIYLDVKGKIKTHVKLEKGAKAFIIKGKYTGTSGVVEEKKDSQVKIKIDKKETILPLKNIIVQ